MEKKLFYLFALICSMSLFMACHDDKNKVNTSLNASYESSNLALTYSGAMSLGKKVTFNTTDGKSADITLEGALSQIGVLSGSVNPGVIPGEPKVTFSAALQPVKDGYTFEGEHSTDNYTMKYKGAVEKGKLTLELNVRLLGENVLAGNTWALGPYDLNFGEERYPLHIVWESGKPFFLELLPGTLEQEYQPTVFLSLASIIPLIPVTADKKQNLNVNEALVRLLKSVIFMEDGNIVASYSDEADIASPKFKDSPLNMVQYTLKNQKLYLYLNVDAIMAAMQKANSKALDSKTILPLLLPYLGELSPILSNGIPLGYSINANTLKVYIDKELGMKLVNILLPLLKNEQFAADIIEAAKKNKEFENYAGSIVPMLEQAPEVLPKTNKMEIGLNFVK